MSQGGFPYVTISSGCRKELAWGLKNENDYDVKAEMYVHTSFSCYFASLSITVCAH